MEIKRTLKFEADRDLGFAKWMTETVGGERIRHCLQCGLCSAACPLSHYMDYTPRRLMHLAREGFKEEVLSCFTIWLCTSCYACLVECPKNIKVTEVMYALKQRALHDGVYPRRMPVAVLAREFTRMVRGHGRASETWLVFRVFLRTAVLRLLGFSRLGLALLRTGRLRLKQERVRRRDEVAKMLDAVDRERARKEAAA